MKLNLKNTIMLAPAFALVSALASCGAVFDDLEPCSVDYTADFVYKHHLKYGDAFPYEVESVNLYIFDADGNFITSMSENVPRAEAENFSIALPQLEAGNYRALVWAGVKDTRAFAIPDPTKADMNIEDLSCRITRSDNHTIENRVPSLFYGEHVFDVPAGVSGSRRITIPLVKNTNNFRIVLQSQNGDEMDPDRYEFTITDDNGLMAYDNTLIPDGDLTYHAYRKEGASASIQFPGTDAPARTITTVNAVAAEITTGRLIPSHKAVLKVTDTQTGRIVVRVPAIDLALMTKHFDHDAMSDAEYLDRQDAYTMTFLLDKDGSWSSKQVHINKWFVIYNNPTLE